MSELTDQCNCVSVGEKQKGSKRQVGLLHGYELQGSGSNEYVRYLSRALAVAGHSVHVMCRDDAVAKVPFVSRAYKWDQGSDNHAEVVNRAVDPSAFGVLEGATVAGSVTVHILPHAAVRPVFVTDKQRKGNVKAFADMTDEDLEEYHRVGTAALGAVLDAFPVDVVWANHLVYQPALAAATCVVRDIPFVIFPHGSAIEYTVRGSDRFLGIATNALVECDQVVCGSNEVLSRIFELFPDFQSNIEEKAQIVGVGVDTTLFKPIEKCLRKQTIDKLSEEWMRIRCKQGVANSQDPLEIGKTQALSEELFRRLDDPHRNLKETVQMYVKEGYDHSQTDADMLPKLESIDWDKPVMMFVGALTAGKGVQSLLLAMPRILKKVPDAQLIIVGAGAYREGLEAFQHSLATGNKDMLLKLTGHGFDLDRSHLKGPFADIGDFLADETNLTEALQVGDKIRTNVKFVGRMNHDLLQFLFPCVDIAIFPSVVPEAYPLVMMESLSNGVLPLVTNFSGFKDGLDELEQWIGSDWIRHLRIPNDQATRVSEIAKNLIATFQNPELKTLRPRLRQIAVDRYDWNVRAQQVLAAIDQTIKCHAQKKL